MKLKGKSACATGWLAGWGKWAQVAFSAASTQLEPVPLHGLDPGLQVGLAPTVTEQVVTETLSFWAVVGLSKLDYT